MSALAALGLLLTTATQLRLGGLPIGPGEVFLVIWIGLAFLGVASRGGPPLTPAFSRMVVFWAVFAVAESLGTLTGYVIGDSHDTGLFLHDILAYPLMAAFSCLCVAGQGAETRLHRMAWALAAFGAAFLLPQLAAGWDLTDLPLIEPWFGDRFRGWSNNPNQLGFLCALLVLVALHLADRAGRRGEWIAAVACSVPPFCVGRLTKTDTFTFALIAGGAAFSAMKLRIWMISPQIRRALRPRTAVVVVIAAPLMLASFAPFLLPAIGNPDTFAMGLMKNGGKEAAQETDLRLQLWQEAVDRGLEAGMLGLGPGPHLPIPVPIVAAREAEPGLDTGDHPSMNGMPNFEAHNTFLDLFTQGGLIAVLGFAWLMITALAISYKARLAGLTALLCGLIMFALTNLIIREPIFWFGIAFCLVARNRTRRVPAIAARNASHVGT